MNAVKGKCYDDVEVIQAMRRVSGGKSDAGAAVSVARVRAEMGHLDQRRFRKAMLGAAERGVVMLMRYDFTAGLSEAERAELVPDGEGAYYCAVARWID